MAVFLILSFQSAFADFKQFLSGQEGMNNLEDVELKADPAYSHKNEKDFLKDVKPSKKNGHLSGDRSEGLEFERMKKGEGMLPLGVVNTEEGYLQYTKKDQLARNNLQGQVSYGFTFLKDDFDYDDGRGTFETIFSDPKDASKGGYFILSRDSYYYRGRVDLFWRGNLGFGLSYGQGTFSDGSDADANFRLWKIPGDLGLGLALPLGNLFSLNIAAGASAVGIWQNRSDVNKQNERRNRRQMSLGYFTEAKFKYNMSSIFKNSSFTLYREFDVSNFYLDFNIRQHEYSGFKEENLSISGQSMGLGFSFEFL